MNHANTANNAIVATEITSTINQTDSNFCKYDKLYNKSLVGQTSATLEMIKACRGGCKEAAAYLMIIDAEGGD